MSTTTIRVSEKTHRTLSMLARQAEASMAEIVDRAIELYRRQRILDEGNAGYAALRQDPVAWAELQAERAVWDATLSDGLERGQE
jgi:hypothetical protein